MSYPETKHLRVLIANERKDRLALVAPIVVALGHEVIAREIDIADVGPATAIILSAGTSQYLSLSRRTKPNQLRR